MSTVTADPVISPSVAPELLREYKEQGFVVLRGLIPPAAAAALRDEVMGIMEVIGLGQTKLKQTGQYVAGSAIDGLVNSPNLRRVASELMEGPSTLYMPFTAVKSGGGGGEFHFHQDNQYTRFDGPGINLWFALTPMTEENGCLRCVPRSHLNGTLPSFSPENDGHKAVTFDPEEFVPVLMEPGDCVAFTRLTVHGSGPNATPEHRVAYAIQFHRDDVSWSADGGETWKLAKDNPRWQTGPVERITAPQGSGKQDGH
jgi:2-oxoglutarate-dependent dioxygenase